MVSQIHFSQANPTYYVIDNKFKQITIFDVYFLPELFNGYMYIINVINLEIRKIRKKAMNTEI